MAMDVNEIDYFDDDIDDISQYSEPDLTGIDDNQEPIQATLYEFEEDDHQMSTNEDDVITTMLKNRGINPTAIKMQNENGEIEEVNFNDLSVEEQLQILQDENIEESYGLDDNEINLINTLRSNNFSVEDYNNYIAKKAIEDYLYALKNKNFCDCEATELSLCLRDAVKFDGMTEQQKQILIDKINERGENEE